MEIVLEEGSNAFKVVPEFYISSWDRPQGCWEKPVLSERTHFSRVLVADLFYIQRDRRILLSL